MLSDAYCKRHYISYCPDLSTDCPYCRIAQLEAQVDTLKTALMDEVRDGVKAKLAALGGEDE